MNKIAYMALFAAIHSAIFGCIAAFTGEKRESLATRIQNLEDREEIRHLLIHYGRFLDQKDFASFSSLFAEKEGEWIGGMGKAKGAQAIRGLMEENIGGKNDKEALPNYHLFMNDIIHVEGNRADATTKWMFVAQGGKSGPQPYILGHYEDTFIRENGRWKFLKRIVFADIPTDKDLSNQ
jgi:hypothetical protein